MRRLIVILALGAVALQGCGAERQSPPDVATAQAPVGTRAVRFAQDGIRFTAPGNWRVTRGQAPLVATVSSGRATIAIYRYHRVERLPHGTRQISAAAAAHSNAALTRDPKIQELANRVVRYGGLRGFQLRAAETIVGQPRTVLSTHLFGHRAEFVVDAFAPAEDFPRVDPAAFRPLLASLHLSRPAGGA
jgi:hypothetical protein